MSKRKARAAGEDYSADDEVTIEHEDGRRYGVTYANYQRLYRDQGFTVVEQPLAAPATQPAAGGATEEHADA